MEKLVDEELQKTLNRELTNSKTATTAVATSTVQEVVNAELASEQIVFAATSTLPAPTTAKL